jgi:hypothetical protein
MQTHKGDDQGWLFKENVVTTGNLFIVKVVKIMLWTSQSWVVTYTLSYMYHINLLLNNPGFLKINKLTFHQKKNHPEKYIMHAC